MLVAAGGCNTALKVPSVNDVKSAVTRSQAPSAPSGPITMPTLTPQPEVKPELKTAPAITPVSNVETKALTSSDGQSLRYTQVKVAASIGHEAVITEDEVLQMVRGRIRDYGELTGTARATKEKQIYNEELKELINRELIVLELFDRMKKNKAEAKIEELKKHASDTAKREISDRKKRQGLADMPESEFVRLLAQQGMTYKTLVRQIEQDVLCRIYLEQLVKDKIKYITLNDLWDYYQAHPKEFAVENRVKWLDLFVSFRNFKTADEAKAHATKAWKEAMAGGDFATLVKKYGQGDSNLRDGEGVGAKAGEIQPTELEPVLFDMDANQVSPLLQTGTGYHIVKVIERDKAGTHAFDEKVQAAIRNKLSVQVQDKERARIVEDLWRRHRPKVVEQ
ncbi:hypothetical protein BH11PLA2_BH11PLA2_05310 [soil metagenome]